MATPIEERYIQKHPKAQAHFNEAKNIFPDGVTHDARRLQPFPLYITRAEGSHKWDVDGNKIIDYKTGHGSMLLGHSHPAIVKAVQDAMSKGTHMGQSTEAEIRWGKLVQDLIPCAEKVRFNSSGTEAVMMVMKLVRAYTGKSKIIKFTDHFHGWSDYAQAGGAGLGGIPQETLDTMIVLPPNDIGLVEKTLKSRNDVAAVMLEPTGAHMGLEPILPSFLTELRDLTKKHNVLLHFDEVVTGFRISKGGASGYYGVIPDITSLAKIVGGGLPGAAVAGRADIIDQIKFHNDPDYDRNRRVGHPGTFNANPLSAAAGATALELIKTTPVNEKNDKFANKLKAELNSLLGKLEVPGCVSGVNGGGLLFMKIGVDHDCDKEVCVMSPEDFKKTQNAKRNSQLQLALLNHGIDPMSNGTRLITSAAHTDQDVTDTVAAYEKALTEVREVGLL